MLKALWRKEVNLRALGFSHDRPQHFVQSQWQKAEGVSVFYLVYRWVFALFFLSVLIYSLYKTSQDRYDQHPLAKWPIYLTHWGYTLCTVQAILATGLVTQRYIKERATVGHAKLPIHGDEYECICCSDKQDMQQFVESYDGPQIAIGFIEDHAQMPRIYKIYWFMHTMAVVIAIGITASYFVVDYDPAVHALTALNLLVHAFNSIFMIMDIIVIKHPFRLLHFIYSFLFIIIYFIFTVIYYLLGGTGRANAPSIYPALDWRKVKTTLPVATLGALSVILAHFCIWLVVIARRKLAREDECKEELRISKPFRNQVQPISVA